MLGEIDRRGGLEHPRLSNATASPPAVACFLPASTFGIWTDDVRVHYLNYRVCNCTCDADIRAQRYTQLWESDYAWHEVCSDGLGMRHNPQELQDAQKTMVVLVSPWHRFHHRPRHHARGTIACLKKKRKKRRPSRRICDQHEE